MQINRKIDLSVYYYLEDLLPSLVTVEDGFPVDDRGVPSGDLSLPTVATNRLPITIKPFELGGAGLLWCHYAIDIYANSKTQNDDLAYLIQSELDNNNIPVNDYDEGFPPAVTPSRIGTLVIVGDITNSVVYIFPEVTQKLYWRAVVDFIGYYSPS